MNKFKSKSKGKPALISKYLTTYYYVGIDAVMKASIIVLLVALFSGCIDSTSNIEGTYTRTATDPYSHKTSLETLIIYNEGTWFFYAPNDSNGGSYTKHGNEIILTGQLVVRRLTIMDDGHLQDEGNLWLKSK